MVDRRPAGVGGAVQGEQERVLSGVAGSESYDLTSIVDSAGDLEGPAGAGWEKVVQIGDPATIPEDGMGSAGPGRIR